MLLLHPKDIINAKFLFSPLNDKAVRIEEENCRKHPHNDSSE